MKDILIADRFDEETLKKMREDFPHRIEHLHNSEIKKKYPNTEILIIRSRTKINNTTLQFLPQLKYIVSATSGFDHIDFKECKKNYISLEYCPESNRISAAELTWALILNAERYINEQNQYLKDNQWRKNQSLGNEVKGKKIFIIGFGRIGSLVAKYAKVFGLHVFVYDPYVDIPEDYKSIELEEGLKQADIVSLHVPKTIKTAPLIKREHIALLQKDALLVNTARGDVIAKGALGKILEEKKIRLAFDVFDKEPLEEGASLMYYEKALLSPHIGAFTKEAFQKASFDAYIKVKQFLNKEAATHPIPPDVAWLKDL